jgi:hypothetical protein
VSVHYSIFNTFPHYTICVDDHVSLYAYIYVYMCMCACPVCTCVRVYV